MVVLCDGMLRSGSTWSFNVALELVRSYDPQRKVFGFYSENPAVLLAAVRPRFSHLVIKSHSLDPSAYGLCSAGAIKAIYTWRHPYDTVVSCMRMFDYSFDHSVTALLNALRVWSFHRTSNSACIVAYESIIQAPLAGINTIASYLGVHIEPSRAREIAEATSLERVKTLGQTVDRLDGSRLVRNNGYVYDRQTLLHQNHIRNGRIGYGAEQLNSEQLAAIDAVVRDAGFDFLCDPDSGRILESAACRSASDTTARTK